MRTRSSSGGRHELGQNFLTHRPTLQRLADLAAETRGAILEIGAGDGALTERLAGLGRDLRAVEIDERRLTRLRARVPSASVRHADALREPLDRPVIVGNIPFHLTTPILRRLLTSRGWQSAILVTQWEVARKRASVGGGTMMTAQAAPWFSFELHGRVPARHFAPQPSVDGGILVIRRRENPLIDHRDRQRYERFVRDVFLGRGRGMRQILRSLRHPAGAVNEHLRAARISPDALPRDLTAEQWAPLWGRVRR
ncbi:MAG: 23S ribosomal RNA methyltransferase Erm [Actinomycetota bacterium]